MNISKDAVQRIIRTAIQAFIATYGATNLVSALGGSSSWDVSLARAAAVSALITVVSALYNVFLDPSPVPSLAPPTVDKPVA